MPSLNRTADYRKSPGAPKVRADRCLEIYAASGGSRTIEGAHAKERRLRMEAPRFVRACVLAGSTARALAFIDLLLNEVDRTPVRPLFEAIRLEGQAGRAQDDAAEMAVLGGCTAEELYLLDTRSLRAITEAQALRRSIMAERQARTVAS
jgi:hypothetical protein